MKQRDQRALIVLQIVHEPADIPVKPFLQSRNRLRQHMDMTRREAFEGSLCHIAVLIPRIAA
jgi:hypothetical protein